MIAAAVGIALIIAAGAAVGYETARQRYQPKTPSRYDVTDEILRQLAEEQRQRPHNDFYGSGLRGRSMIDLRNRRRR